MAEASSTAISSSPCHLEGLTRVCFAPDGQTIFTGGSDCLVRIHKADNPDAEPGFHDNHDFAVTSLTSAGSSLVTGSVDNIARSFSYPENQFQGFITRSSGVPIRWVSLDKKGERVAVCSDDLLVKIIHVNDTTRVSLLSDNTKSVRSATWDPSGRYLTTAGCDGKLRIYDVSEATPVLLKIMDGVLVSSEPDSNTSCYAAWQPSGNCFAVPTRTNEVAIISREGWIKQTTLTPDGPKASVSELAWSPNGRYLVSAAGTQIHVWSMETRQIIARYTNAEGNITGLAFSPTSNLVAFTSMDGSFSRWTDPVPSNLPSPTASDAVQAKKLERLLDDDFGDDDLDLEDQGEDLADDWLVDDVGGYLAEDGDHTKRSGRTEVVNVTKAQESFTPGSTSMRNKKRYLAFNMIGVVDVTDQETHHVINVEFHDKSARRGYHFQDHHKYTMAALGEQGIVYATPSDEDQPSQVYYRPYDSWSTQADWTVNLLLGEEALTVAAGGQSGDGMGSVIVATSKGYVRFLSGSGIQRYIWRMGEDMVTMAAGKDAVMLVYREGGTSLDGCQNLRYSIVDLESFELIQEGRVPLPRKVTLTWAGFSQEGIPAIFDSTGLLSTLDRYRRPGQARWVPLLDSSLLAREGRQETYWPVGITDTHFTCVILKGTETEPWFPRPLIQELDMRMPLLNMDNEQGKREEAVIRGEVQISQLRDSIDISPDSELEYTLKQKAVVLDKELLQLVQGACKADNLQRALDLTRLMHNPATIEAAAKIAGFYHLPGLQERIMTVERKKRRRPDSRPAIHSHIHHQTSAPTSAHHNGNGNGAGNGNGNGNGAKGFSDFAPRDKPRRSFGGKVRDRDSTPASSSVVGTAATPLIPETPRTEFESTPFEDSGVPATASPEFRRKRDRDIDEPTLGDEEHFAPPTSKRPTDKDAPKNPFAKKAAGNPFAKPAVAKPLDAIKSTSFFDRVDNIESAPPSASDRSRQKSTKGGNGNKVNNATSKRDESGSGGGGGKQQTLFSLKSAPTSAPASASASASAPGQTSTRGLGASESIALTETDPDESLMMEEEEEEMQEAQAQSLDPDLLQDQGRGAEVEGEEEEGEDIRGIERVGSPDWDDDQADVEM